jgi:hypothetical protein
VATRDPEPEPDFDGMAQRIAVMDADRDDHLMIVV